jgi:hypothetical protein
MKFTRKIKMSDPILPYSKDSNIGYLSTELNNCNWNAMKHFYGELEFLLTCSKYVDINKCLVVYVGAQPGHQLKEILIKHFFPKLQMLLYDELPFDIQEDQQIIIKTGDEGIFTNKTVDEVLKIANGRKILYINAVANWFKNLDKVAETEHDDLQNQQEWGVLMGADFMMVNFRMFLYTDENPVNFIDNNRPIKYADKIVYEHDEIKHKSISNFMLYLKGTMFSRLYSTKRTIVVSLFVKKIKYHKDHNNYSNQDQEKYKMIYYDNLHHEGLMNYHNIKIRSEPCIYKKSDKLVKYLPGNFVSHTSASEYYLIRKYLKYANNQKHPTFKEILNKIVLLYTLIYEKHVDNLITCIQKNYKPKKDGSGNAQKRDTLQELYYNKIDSIIENSNKQFDEIRKTNMLDKKMKKRFIKSYDTLTNVLVEIKDGYVEKKL